MGYSLSNLANLPNNKQHHFYIFLLGTAYYKGGLLEKLCNNFDIIAEQIGPNAVIAKGFNLKEWTQQISEIYLKDIEGLYNHFPGILVTNAHPEDFNSSAVRILISLDQAKKQFDTIEHFFDLLIRFIKNNDKDFVKFAKGNVHWVDRLNKIVELKPNVIGFGINLNELISMRKKSKKLFRKT